MSIKTHHIELSFIQKYLIINGKHKQQLLNFTTMETMTTTPAIFLTDYASYNNGTQFEFGHWVQLDQFSDVDELMEYVKDHFQEADEKSPLDSPREEIMITDFEGFPDALYSEAMSYSEFENIFKLIDYMEQNGIESLENEGDNLLNLWNEYSRENNMERDIFYFDDYTLEMMIGTNINDAFTAGLRAQVNYSDDYLIFNGAGNIESLEDPSREINESVLIPWIIENLI